MSKTSDRPPQANPPLQTRRLTKVLLAIFLLALCVRFLHIWQMQDSPLSFVKLGDAKSYHAWAQEIAGGDWIGNQVFYQAPLYPYFLGTIYTFFGENPLVVRLCQSILGALSCVLLARVGARLFSERTGIVAGIIHALYGPAIFFDYLIQKAALAMFFLCLLLWFLSNIITHPRRMWCFWAGVVTGLLILTRENALVLVFPILLWIVVHHRKSAAASYALAAIFVTGSAVVLLPVAIRNYAVGGEFHLTTSQFGPNLYIGNNKNADGIYRPLRTGRGDAMYERKDAVALAEAAVGRTLTPKEVSRYWTGKVLDYIKSEPLGWLKLMLRKFALVWNGTEAVDSEDQYTYADWSWPLRFTATLLHFGLIMPLAFLGVVLTWAKRKQLWLLYLMIAVYAASVVAFFVFARYRYPLVPFLTLFASAALAHGLQILRSSNVTKIVGVLVVTILVAAFCNWRMSDKDRMRAVTYNNIGNSLAEKELVDQAMDYYRRSLDYLPNFPGALNNLGGVLTRKGQVDEGLKLIQRALQIEPKLADAHFNLAATLATQDKFDQAIERYREGLHLQDDYHAHIGLGSAFHMQGKYQQAIAEYQAALKLKEDGTEAHINWGIALTAQEKYEQAINHYRIALELDPESAEAIFALARTHHMEGRTDEAIALYQQGLQIKGDTATARCQLGNIYRERGDFDQAISHYRQALQADPNLIDAHGNLANILLRQSKLEEAISQYRQALLIESESAQLYHNLGMALKRTGDLVAAKTSFEQAIQLDSEAFAPLNSLAWIFASSADADHDEALRLAQRADELTEHKNPAVLDTLAVAYAATGQFKQAVATAELALTLIGSEQTQVIEEVRGRLALYQEGKPYVEEVKREK